MSRDDAVWFSRGLANFFGAVVLVAVPWAAILTTRPPQGHFGPAWIYFVPLVALISCIPTLGAIRLLWRFHQDEAYRTGVGRVRLGLLYAMVFFEASVLAAVTGLSLAS